jgi:hypothetical protein
VRPFHSELRYCCTARDSPLIETPLVDIPAGVSGSSGTKKAALPNRPVKQRVRSSGAVGCQSIGGVGEDPDRLNSCYRVCPLTWLKKR